MVNHGRSVIFAAVSEKRIEALGLPMMTPKANIQSPEFTVSVEARQGVSTGISANDRARTLRTLAKTESAKLDLVTPGHIFPVRAKEGGVLVRSTPAEATVDLLTLSGLTPVAAYCHCVSEQGNFLTTDEITQLAQNTGLLSIRISDIVRHRLATETVIEKISEAKLPIKDAGEFQAYCFRSKTDGAEHLALVKGEIQPTGDLDVQNPILVRVQAEERIGDLLGTRDTFSRQRIKEALRKIDQAGRGIFIYVRHPQRTVVPYFPESIPQSKDSDSTASQLREYGIGAQILNSLGAKKVKLLSNSSHDIGGITAFQIELVERVNF